MSTAATAFTRACALGERLSIPAKHSWGRYYADDRDAARRWSETGQVVLRYAPGENFNGSLHDIAGVCNEAGQRVRPDAPPRARGRRADGGSTDGLKIFESMRLAVEGAHA